MLHESEVVMLALGFGVLLFALRQWSQLRRIPDWPLLFASFGLLVVSWTATVLETWFLPEPLNVLEHATLAVAAVLLACWCWRWSVAGRDRGAEA